MKGKKKSKTRTQAMILRVIGNVRLVEGKQSVNKATGHVSNREILALPKPKLSYELQC